MAFLAYHGLFLVRLAMDRPSVSPGATAQPATYLAEALAALPVIMTEGLARVHIALLSLGLWAVAVGAGMAILRWSGYRELTPGERAVFGGGLGMGILSLGTFLLGSASGRPAWLLSVLLPALVLALAAIGLRDLCGAIAGGARSVRAWSQGATRASLLVILLGAAVVLLALTWVNIPVLADYDSLEYHLAAPARWQREGRISFIPEVVYTNFPLNAEMLCLLAMTCCRGAMLGTVVGLQVGIGFAVLTAGAIAVCGRRLGNAAAGRAGAALFLATPMLPELVTLNSYVVELPLTAYSFLALFAFLGLRRCEAPRARWRRAVLCGVMAGLAVGCKYPAVLFVLVPLAGFIVGCGLVRRTTLGRSLGEAAVVSVVALLVVSPWLVRNAVNTGNPTYPLLYRVFGSRDWTPQQDAKFAKAHRPHSWSPWDLGRRFWVFATWRDQPDEEWGGKWRPPAAPLIFLFALIPLAVGAGRGARAVLYATLVFLAAAAVLRFRPPVSGVALHAVHGVVAAGVVALLVSPVLLARRGEALFLHLYFVSCLVAWYLFTHRVDRFLEPATPALALLGGIGLTSLSGPRLRRAAGCLVGAGLAYAFATKCLVHSLLFAPGLTLPAETILAHVPPFAPMHTVNQLDEDSLVLFVGEAKTFYCRRRVIAPTVFDRQPIDQILDESSSPDRARAVREGLRRLGVTHVYVDWWEIRRLGASYGGPRVDGIPQPDGFSPWLNFYRRGLVADLERRGYLRRVVLRTAEGAIVRPRAVRETVRGATVTLEATPVLYELR